MSARLIRFPIAAASAIVFAAVTATAAPLTYAQTADVDPPSHVDYLVDRWYLDDVPQRPSTDLGPSTHDDWPLQFKEVE